MLILTSVKDWNKQATDKAKKQKSIAVAAAINTVNLQYSGLM